MGKKRAGAQDDIRSSSKPARNQSKKGILIILVVAITAALISWVYMLSQKATQTITVCMWANSMYKNEQITEDDLQAYDMVLAEYEKYATVSDDGTTSRRIVLWDERDTILGGYAAYPLFANTFVEYDTLYKSRVDNSDSVLYSYPGKSIVQLEVATDDLQTFKTFLSPGDRLDITAVFTEEEEVIETDNYGNETTSTKTFYRTESMFEDIAIADLLNSNGDSILDIYEDYNSKSVTEQAALADDDEWQDSVEPSTLLLALTPEELEVYYLYLTKSNCEFRISLPQRVS